MGAQHSALTIQLISSLKSMRSILSQSLALTSTCSPGWITQINSLGTPLQTTWKLHLWWCRINETGVNFNVQNFSSFLGDPLSECTSYQAVKQMEEEAGDGDLALGDIVRLLVASLYMCISSNDCDLFRPLHTDGQLAQHMHLILRSNAQQSMLLHMLILYVLQ